MDLFLTSAIGATKKVNGERVTGKINDRYGFLSLFKKCLQANDLMLYISSDPKPNPIVTTWFRNTVDALAAEGIVFRENCLINGENAKLLAGAVPRADVIFLSGGHLPTQNQFFQDIGLSRLLKGYQGVVVGQSAGSMNCAETVYVCPEIPGEGADKAFKRFRPGLGLTDINLIPHYNQNCDFVLDGQRLYEGIIYPDTFTVPLYVLTDGSYIYVDKTRHKHFFGEFLVFRNGKMSELV